MCNHLECHGGKLRIRKVVGAYIVGRGDEPNIPIPPYWEVGFTDDWFPVASRSTWAEAMWEAEMWLRENNG